jgi:hypothetical protein
VSCSVFLFYDLLSRLLAVELPNINLQCIIDTVKT